MYMQDEGTVLLISSKNDKVGRHLKNIPQEAWV